MSVPKLERLMNLVAALLHTSAPVSADVLRARVEGYDTTAGAFRRQFERDKEDLREMGVPIRVESIPGSDPPLDGYRIERSEYYLPDPGLDAEELAALHLATRTVPVAGPRPPSGLWKLGGVPPSGREPGTAPLATIPADPNLAALYDAATEAQRGGFLAPAGRAAIWSRGWSASKGATGTSQGSISTAMTSASTGSTASMGTCDAWVSPSTLARIGTRGWRRLRPGRSGALGQS